MKRYPILDEIRGVTLISMILYHGCWNLVHLFQFGWQWYESPLGYVWQQSICWTFILLSGFCWQLGRKQLRRGATVFAAGLLVTAATLAVMPQSRIIFGVLTLLGTSMLLTIPLHKFFVRFRIPPLAGLVVSSAVFMLTRNVNDRFLGFEGWNLLPLPEGWYANWVTTFLGFPAPGFFSTDYFSLIPWFFLFLTGYFLYSFMASTGRLAPLKGSSSSSSKALKNADLSMPLENAGSRAVSKNVDSPKPSESSSLPKLSASTDFPAFSTKVRRAQAFHPAQTLSERLLSPARWMGRHSLLVYLLHQPLLYALCLLLFR